MKIEFNLTGNDCKELVKAISEITGAAAEYQYMPTCAYIIGSHTATKDGTLVISEDADEKEIQYLLAELECRGYEIPSTESNKLTVQLPIDSLCEPTINRLKHIIENKGAIFKSAFKTDCLDILKTEKHWISRGLRSSRTAMQRLTALSFPCSASSQKI